MTGQNALRAGQGRMAAPIRVRAAGQSRCGSVTISFGKGYWSYIRFTTGSHARYNSMTAPGPRRFRRRAQGLFSTNATFRAAR